MAGQAGFESTSGCHHRRRRHLPVGDVGGLIAIGVSDEDIEPIGFAGTRFALAAVLLLPLALPGSGPLLPGTAVAGGCPGVAIYGLLLFGLAQVGFYLALGQLEASTRSGSSWAWPPWSPQRWCCAAGASGQACSNSAASPS